MSAGRLSGKTVVVTGAGSGIGRAIALHCAKEGASVVVGDVAETGEATASAIRDTGGRAWSVQGDLREEAAAHTLMQFAQEQGGGLHGLVCNAGVTGTTNVVTATDEDWERIMSINLKGAWYCAKHAIPYMTEAGGGSVVNISSTHATRTQFNHFPYQAAKGGMQAMTLGICVDYGGQGIRVNNLVPGFVMTPLARRFLDGYDDPAAKEQRMLKAHPLGRLGTPEDIAAAAIFLLSDDASFISGTSLVVDGGRSAYQQSD